MIIPNAVSRIDAITEAIRDGDRKRAVELLDAERKRQRERVDFAYQEYSRLYRRLATTTDFAVSLKKVEFAYQEYGRLHSRLATTNDFAVSLKFDDDVWHQARRESGWQEG